MRLLRALARWILIDACNSVMYMPMHVVRATSSREVMVSKGMTGRNKSRRKKNSFLVSPPFSTFAFPFRAGVPRLLHRWHNTIVNVVGRGVFSRRSER